MARTYRIGAIVGAIQSTGRSLVRGKVRADKVQTLIDCQPRRRAPGREEEIERDGDRGREREAECICGCERNGNGDKEKGEETADRSLSMRENLAEIRGAIPRRRGRYPMMSEFSVGERAKETKARTISREEGGEKEGKGREREREIVQ